MLRSQILCALIYVAVQVRHATRETQTISVQAAYALDHEFLLTIDADPITAQLWATYLSAPDTLADDQLIQGAYLMTSLVRWLENIYLQKILGSLSEEAWKSRQALIVGIARSPGYSAFLESTPAALTSEEFRNYMAQLISDECNHDRPLMVVNCYLICSFFDV